MSSYILPGQQAPYSQEAEEAVLGAILTNGDAFVDVAEMLIADDFYILRHSYIFEACQRIAANPAGGVIDFVTVQEELRAQGRLNDVGGAGYLLQLINNTPSSSRAMAYAELVARAGERRRWMTYADEIKALAMDEEMSLEDVRAEIEKRRDMPERAANRNEPTPIRQSIDDYFAMIEATDGLGEDVTGLATGFTAWDELLDGFQDGSLNILAARPGMGKSALALCVVLNVVKELKAAAAAGKPLGGVYIWSGEMPERQLNERLMSIETGIPNRRLRRGLRPNIGMSRRDWEGFVKGAGELGQYPIFLDDAPGMTPAKLKKRVRRLHRRTPGGLRLIVVDYIGLMEAGFKKENRVNEIGYISRQLKILAGEICPILCLSQLNRSLESRADKRPVLSDLRDSGDVEQDADTVTFIYRDVVYNPATEDPNKAEIILAKNRHGETGTAINHFERGITKFSNAIVRRIDVTNGEIIEEEIA